MRCVLAAPLRLVRLQTPLRPRAASVRASSQHFTSLGLSDAVVTALRKLGFAEPTPIQALAAPPLLAGAHVVIAAETGSGKTFAYLAPLISRLMASQGSAAVLCPNGMLALQVAEAANSLTDSAGVPLLRAVALTPDLTLRAATAAGTPLVVCTPARLLEEVFEFSSGRWRTHASPPAAAALRTLVVDEADMLLSGGFEAPMKRLVQLLDRAEQAEQAEEAEQAEASAPPPSSRQFVFAAATVHSSGRRTPGEALRLGFPDAVWVEGPRLHRSAAQLVHAWTQLPDSREVEVEEEDEDELGLAVASALHAHAGGQAMVFVNSAALALRLAAHLGELGGLSVQPYCAEVPSSERAASLAVFRAGQLSVLVCTDAAARGLDVPAVAHVVQAQFALSAVDVLHRVGRTARAGAPGRVTSLFRAQAAALVAAVRQAVERGERVEDAFSRKRSFRKKFKKFGESRRGVSDPEKAARSAAAALKRGPPRARGLQ